jgi:hypothetical protein
MIETEERDGSRSKLDLEYEKLMQDIERRRMLMVLGFIIWNLACLSLLFMPLIQLLELESHYPMMFGNVAISFGLLCYYWRRQDPTKNENQ